MSTIVKVVSTVGLLYWGVLVIVVQIFICSLTLFGCFWGQHGSVSEFLFHSESFPLLSSEP